MTRQWERTRQHTGLNLRSLLLRLEELTELALVAVVELLDVEVLDGGRC
jgi:hypothetical protein